METKAFPLGVLLTATTGRLLTTPRGERDNGIGDLYELLGWMTNDQPFTHQLGRFGEECKPWLLRWFPELADVEANVTEFCDALKQVDVADGCIDRFLHELGNSLGKHEYDVPRIAYVTSEVRDLARQIAAVTE
jgi:hypothetical protein